MSTIGVSNPRYSRSKNIVAASFAAAVTVAIELLLRPQMGVPTAIAGAIACGLVAFAYRTRKGQSAVNAH